MKLKDKRKKAFLEYIDIIYKIEEIFYIERESILSVPSINNDLKVDIKSLSLFDLIFTSINKIKNHYISRYSLLINFLEEGIRFNKKYKLGYTTEINEINNKINEIKNKLISLNEFQIISPYDKFKDTDIKFVIEFYEEYISDVQGITFSARIKINNYDFDYRKYFKDDFYRHIKKLNILMDLITGSHETIVNIAIYYAMKEFDEDID